MRAKTFITLTALSVLATALPGMAAAEDASSAPVQKDAAKQAGSAAEEDIAVSSDKGAKNFVVGISDKVFKVMNSQTFSAEKKESVLADIFNKYVDTKWMGTFVLGRYMQQLSPEQKKHYLELYHDYMIHSYVPRFRDYTGRDYEILRTEEKTNGEVVVQVRLKSMKGSEPDVNAYYRLHKTDGTYKVIDFSGEGVSMITTQRSDFGGMISQKGVEHFLERLEAKVKSQAKE